MRVVRVEVGPLQVNCWLVRGEVPGDAWAVIDPGDDADRILTELGGEPVGAIVLTHAHFDHIGAVDGIVEATAAPIYIHEADADRLTSSAAAGTGAELFGFDHVSPPADHVVRDGDVITVGSLRLEVLHTPGHTAGGMSLVASDAGQTHVFSGDTLFAGSVGRTDFPAGDSRALLRTLAEKFAPLPGEAIVHPGHGPDTTIRREARINPFWPRA